MTVPAAIPKVAVLFDSFSVSPMGLAAAAEGHWSAVWVVDSQGEGTPTAIRILERLGPVVDVTGVGSAEAAAAIARHRPSGIMAFADSQLTRTAAIADELGLPYYSPLVAERLTNKVSQRRALADAGVDDLGFWAIPAGASVNERAAVVPKVRFPVIVKPQVGNGSRYVSGADSVASLAAYVDEVLDGPDPMDLIVEERLPDGVPRSQQVYGDYLSVESVIVDHQVHHLGVTGRFPLEEPFRESGFFTPADIDPERREQVLDLVLRAVNALEIDHGAVHTEVKLTPSGPRIIEINGRLGGGMSDILELASGYSLLDLAAQASFGRAPDLAGLAPCHRVAFLLYLQAPTTASALETLDGLAETQAISGVESVVMNRRPGDSIDWRHGNHGYFCAVLGTAPDHCTIRELREQILGTVKATFRHEHTDIERS